LDQDDLQALSEAAGNVEALPHEDSIFPGQSSAARRAWYAYLGAASPRIIRDLVQANDRLQQTNAALEGLRPMWAKGYSSDSVAAQAMASALTQIREELGVKNQTETMELLRELISIRDAQAESDVADPPSCSGMTP